MKSKLVSLTLIAVLGIFLLTGLASAISFVDTTGSVNAPSSVAHNAGSFQVTFDINNTAGSAQGTVTLSHSSTGSATISGVTFDSGSSFTLNDGENKTITATVSFGSGQTGNLAGTITASASGSGSPSPIINLIYSTNINSASGLTLTKTKDITHLQNGTISLSNTGNQALNLDLSSTTTPFPVSFFDGTTQVSTVALTAGQSKSLTVAPTNSIPTSLTFGSHTLTVTAQDTSASVTKTVDFTFLQSFCRAGEIGTNLSITDVDIDSDGDDDDKWRPLDTITIEVRVDNVEDSDVEDVVVELAFLDSAGKDKISKFEFDNKDEEKEEIGDIDEGDDEKILFEFKVPGDFEDGSYKLLVKAYSDRSPESTLCTDTASALSGGNFDSISVDREDDEGEFIAFDEIVVSPSEAVCGDTVSVSFEMYNVGEDDEEQVRVDLKGRDFDLELSTEIKEDFDQGDDKSLSFDFTLPEGLEDKTYVLELTARYDYKNGVYREISDDAELIPVRVFGCSGSGSTGSTSGSNTAITASLQSDAVPGEQMTVEVTVTNTANEQRLFTADARGFSSWADLDSISERVFNLNAGESKTLTVRLTPEDDASGQQSFIFEARTADSVQTREVAVNLESGDSPFGDNGLIWIIGIINVVLIILIIIVAVRVSRS